MEVEANALAAGVPFAARSGRGAVRRLGRIAPSLRLYAGPMEPHPGSGEDAADVEAAQRWLPRGRRPAPAAADPPPSPPAAALARPAHEPLDADPTRPAAAAERPRAARDDVRALTFATRVAVPLWSVVAILSLLLGLVLALLIA